jgi:hypothetical protein
VTTKSAIYAHAAGWASPIREGIAEPLGYPLRPGRRADSPNRQKPVRLLQNFSDATSFPKVGSPVARAPRRARSSLTEEASNFRCKLISLRRRVMAQ